MVYFENKDKLVIKNNINLKISREPGTGTGLQNIIKSYNLLSKEPVTFNNNGVYFTVILPVLNKID